MVEDVVKGLGYLTLGSRMKRIGERLQAESRVLLSRAGVAVPSAQFPVLATLDRLGPRSIGDIALALGVAQPGVTRMVDRLAVAGLVTTAPAPDDRRIRTVALTEMGAQLVAAAKTTSWPAVEAAVADACAACSGPLLAQLAALEDALDAASLVARAARLDARKVDHASA